MCEEDIRVIGENRFDEFEAEWLWEVGETEEGRALAFCEESNVIEDSVCVESSGAEGDRAIGGGSFAGGRDVEAAFWGS